MEQEMTSALEALTSTVERLAAPSAMMEQSVERFQARQDSMSGDLARVVAQVESGDAELVRELERKLSEAQQQIATLQAGRSGRKTLPVAAMSLLAKQGISSLESIEAGTIDGALSGLSIEQRIAVKSHLHRAGWLG